MTWRITLTPKAAKDLAGIHEPNHARLIARLQGLTLEPRPLGAPRLKGSHFHRLRAGDWRVIYEIDDTQHLIVVARVLRRSEKTYRDL